MIRVQIAPIDLAAECAALTAQAPLAGAASHFIGRVRADAGLTALTLEFYPEFAEKCLHGIANEASNRWGLSAVRLIHRAGKMSPGEIIVFAGASAAHRREAIEAVQFMMDVVKIDGPFWKREHRPSGEIWVAPRESDVRAAASWSTK